MAMIDTAPKQPAEVTVRHFDPHIHARTGALKQMLLREAAKRMCGGIAEPNTNPHIFTCDDAQWYVDEMNAIAPDGRWAGSIYLSPHSSLAEIVRAWERGLIGHVKGYPPHGTTHSAESVGPELLLDIDGPVGKILCGLAEAGIPFKTHGEVVVKDGKQVHPLNREGLWYADVQGRFDDLYRNRGMRQIHAHITTTEAAEYSIKNGDPFYRVCEVTGHHLGTDWNLLYDGGSLMPDNHWLPVSKDEKNTESLRQLVKLKLPFVHGASDMAGHDTRRKYARRAFGGGYTYHCSLELYVQMLVELDVLDYADDFLYGNAKAFHKELVPSDPAPFRLVRKDWTVGERARYAEGEMTPFGYDEDPKRRFIFQYQLAV